MNYHSEMPLSERRMLHDERGVCV